MATVTDEADTPKEWCRCSASVKRRRDPCPRMQSVSEKRLFAARIAEVTEDIVLAELLT